jgi:hypothetical protein
MRVMKVDHQQPIILRGKRFSHQDFQNFSLVLTDRARMDEESTIDVFPKVPNLQKRTITKFAKSQKLQYERSTLYY